MTDVVIASAVRTPIGAFMGGLSEVPAVELGALFIGEALQRAGLLPEAAQEVMMGNVLQAGSGQGPARLAAMKAGLPCEVPAVTINKICGSGLKAVILAAQAIKAGDADLIVAGGMENMSMAPYLLTQGRAGYRLGDGVVVDSVLKDGLTCSICGIHMGQTAENIAAKYRIAREEQDAFALTSQQRAREAWERGEFSAEIVPVEIRTKKGLTRIEADEHLRPDVTAAALARLKPAFQPDGTVTAGNASGINDGAAALVVCSGRMAKQMGLPVLARIRGYASTGVDPALMGMGPVSAAQSAVKKAGMSLADIDVAELNEAFAAQAIAVIRELGLDPAIVNVNGGAIALGHPIGASGARILVTLLHAMKRRQAAAGLAALCVGGGHGVAVVVEQM
ncbi:acetyl-CoA C-acetyltransferase [Paenibacillus melissococcoides]|uniref:acetyl-CoA C-acetyltransferase n=1 Tax=Paenibacillus melissococcoides TaxID=2912268 RepID=A0ABN8U3P6_9BACL|nr:acetyl-CoA C-acetyltransferase [Paenibacillus melissococcoides]CAH8703381.1 acetyl-CoA C-acetyltransferase [Paenibacillus melissococcoides]CAH8705777.1 acetyl-CoA C-acetyltransferase [Paenibacillus melissococcoides]